MPRRGTLIYVASDLLGMMMSVLVSPFTTRLLTQSQYGAQPSFMALWTVLTLMAYGGMEGAYQYFRSHYRAEEDRARITVAASFIATAVFLFVWAVFAVFSFTSPWLEAYAEIDRTENVLFFVWLIPFNLLNWYLHLLRFNHQFRAFAAASLIGRVVSAAAVIPALLLTPQGERLKVMLAVQIVAQTIAAVIALYELHRFGSFPYIPRLFVVSLARRMLRYGLALVPGAVIYAVADVADRIMVGWFAGPAEVAIVALSLSIRGVVLVFTKWFGIVWEPTVVEWLATKDPEFYLPRLQVVLNTLSVAFFGMACLVAIWIDWLIRAIYPSSYLPAAQLIPFLAISAGCATLSRVAVTTITLAGAPGRYLRNNAFALALEIAVGILTIPVIGALGAALCTLVQEMALLLGWRYIGKVRLKNLPLDWRFALCVMIGAVIFVGAHAVFYVPGSSPLEPILLTAPIVVLAAVYLLRQRGVLVWRHRLHSSA